MLKPISLTLKRGREESLLRRHPWIFSGAVQQIDGEAKEGTLVRIYNYKHECVGIGHMGGGSIAVRMLSFTDCVIDDQFWRERITAAYQLRQALGLTENTHTTTYRLIHGEGDQLPGVIVDVYGATAVMQAHSVGMHLVRDEIAQAIVDTIPQIKNVYYKSEGTLPRQYRSDACGRLVDGYLIGDSETVACLENDMTFEVDWEHGQKTGFFVDQRDNRQLLRLFSAGKSVLNMFCYTGGFSVSALKGGAMRVVSVDSSERAIEQTRRNVDLNFSDNSRHLAICDDGFQFLNKDEELYDIVVLDPPAFAKHRGALHNALKGYTRLNLSGIKHVKKGGLLFTFSCSQVVTKEHFRNAVLGAAMQAGRSAQILYQLHQPADHPVSLYHPEGEYLKGLVIRLD